MTRWWLGHTGTPLRYCFPTQNDSRIRAGGYKSITVSTTLNTALNPYKPCTTFFFLLLLCLLFVVPLIFLPLLLPLLLLLLPLPPLLLRWASHGLILKGFNSYRLSLSFFLTLRWASHGLFNNVAEELYWGASVRYGQLRAINLQVRVVRNDILRVY